MDAVGVAVDDALLSNMCVRCEQRVFATIELRHWDEKGEGNMGFVSKATEGMKEAVHTWK